MNRKLLILKTYLCLYACMAAGFSASAQGSGAGNKSFLLKRFLDKNHLQPIVCSDSTSALLYTHWLDELDARKVYFLSADVADFEKEKLRLCDEIQNKSSAFFDLTASVALKRYKEFDSVAKLFLAKPVDFSQKEIYVTPQESWPKNAEEKAQRIKMVLKYNLLNTIAENIETEGGTIAEKLPANFAALEKEAREQLKDDLAGRWSEFQNNQNWIQTRLLTKWLNSIAWLYDVHSNYFDADDNDEWEMATTAKKYVSGFTINEKDNDFVIAEIQPGSAAWNSGQLHKGDQLLKIKIGGYEKDVSGFDKDELEEFLAGNASSEIELVVKNQKNEIKSVRLLQELETDEENIVKSYLVENKSRFGYIKLPGFYSSENEDEWPGEGGCADDVSKEILHLQNDSIKGLILDLRYNGGGSMWEAVQLAGIFVDIGPIASVKDKTGKFVTLKDPNRGTIYDGPLLILINGASASASEFTSAALQDYKRAIIVGGITYGKGTAQMVVPLDTMWKGDPEKMGNAAAGYVKFTVSKFYRINGHTVQWTGVQPDIALPDPIPYLYGQENSNPTALKPDSGKILSFRLEKPVPLETLQTQSRSRLAADPYFTAITKLITMISNKNPTPVALTWQGFAKYHNETTGPEENEKPAGKPVKIVVKNNSFDIEKDNNFTAAKKELLHEKLKEIGDDEELLEATNILQDLIKP